MYEISDFHQNFITVKRQRHCRSWIVLCIYFLLDFYKNMGLGVVADKFTRNLDNVLLIELNMIIMRLVQKSHETSDFG